MADNPVMELVNVPVPVPSEVWLPATVGPVATPQQTPRAVTDKPPSEVTFPPDAAVVDVIEVAVVVVTAAPPGVKVTSLPLVVPSLFTPTSLK